MPHSRVVSASLLCVLALAACHGKDTTTAASSTDATSGDSDAALPKPVPAGGPVTGMPARPGPGPIGPPSASSTDVPEPATVGPEEAQANVDETVDGNGGDGSATPAPDVPAEPTLDDAVEVVRGYYAALGAHDAARAHAYWAQGLRPPSEPGSDADTVAMSAEVGAPGRMDAAAGSRYVRIPVTLTRSLRDGTTVRSTALVTLRRAVVDGATPEQRAWRITQADVAPATP